jgi:hypothetical protein
MLDYVSSTICDKVLSVDQNASFRQTQYDFSSGKLKNLTEEFFYSDICQFEGFFANSWTQVQIFPSSSLKKLNHLSYFYGTFDFISNDPQYIHLDYNLKYNVTSKRIYTSAKEGLEDNFKQIKTQSAQFRLKDEKIVFNVNHFGWTNLFSLMGGYKTSIMTVFTALSFLSTKLLY